AVAGIAGRRGWALQRPGARTLMAALVTAGLVGVEAASLHDYFAGRVREDDYISLAATMRAYWHEADTVLLHTDQPWPVFAYHWGGPFEGITYTQPVDEAGAAARLDSISDRHNGVWLVLNEDAQRVDPDRVVERLLAGRAAAQREWRFGSKRLVLFTLAAGRAATIMELSPTWAPSTPPARLVSSEVELVGWEQALRRYRPGDVAHLFATVDLTPGCVSASGCAPVLTLNLGNPAAPLASATTVAGPSGAGQRQRLQFDVLIPPEAPAGRSPWTLTQGQQHVTTGAAAVLARPASAATRASEIAVPLETTFGEPPLLKLLGYDLRSHVAPGESAHLTLYWQGLRTIPLPFKVFTHIIDADERMWGQKDDVPVSGTRPTTGWMPGEIIVDGYEIAVSPDTPAGRYIVEIGLYDAGTGMRLGPVRDADGRQLNGERVLLGEIEVRVAD
ncbi:MAG TPA: hypothetical protein VER55_05655, partial [Ardenticatenaceae bacterium]|nr:hypothetical protein [Ardenticatenaceae bacterium]